MIEKKSPPTQTSLPRFGDDLDAGKELVPVTPEELHFACMAADAAARGKTPRQSFKSKQDEAKRAGKLKPGKHLVLTDHPMNHAGMAIMEAFPESTPDGQRKRLSLLWRALSAMAEIHRDPRFAECFSEENGEPMVEEELIDAVATVPMFLGQPVPLDAILQRYRDLRSTRR